MLKQRQQAITAVATEFMAAEKAIEAGAMHAAKCVATIIEHRTQCNLPLETGAEALQMIADALNDALAARLNLFAAHKLLAEIPKALRMPPMDYGDTGCPDTFAQPGAHHLSIVG